MSLYSRIVHSDSNYINPTAELNAGIWTLYAGATIFLGARLWSKLQRRHGLWWDDYILIVCWLLLTANDIIISVEYATGYVAKHWDDRMHILINITSDGTLINQALTKTAFAVTLLKLTKGWQSWILYFCIVTMDSYTFVKALFQQAKVCGNDDYQQWYRLDFCIGDTFRDRFKEGGNWYNIIMDFVFAIFPWFITWNLDMKRKEKIALCITMSLGMIIAIESAIRTNWKFSGNTKDEWYIWRNALSNIWYSSEVCGTIIVQCVPVLRPLVRDMHTSLRSKRLASTIDEVALEDRSKSRASKAGFDFELNRAESQQSFMK